jgi:hypothetical protein
VRAVAALIAAGALLTGCGGGGGDKAQPGPPADASAAPPAQLQQASCRDWMRVGDQGRHTLLGKIRSARQMQITGDAVPGVASGVHGRGTVLTDDQATRLLNSYCGRPRSAQLRLYKLYSFAANYVGGR